MRAVIVLIPAAVVAQQPAPRDYVLGPEDQITIRVLDAEEIDNKPVRVDFSGFIRLPMVGRIQAGGLTVNQLETELVRELKKYIRDPQVAVSVTEFRSQPVSVLGAVRNPGVHQVQGRKTLLEIISLAGGIDPEAGHSIKITRRKEYGSIPLKSAVADETGEYTVAVVDLASILEARNPAENIEVKPNDVITVPRGQLVYLVVRAGRTTRDTVQSAVARFGEDGARVIGTILNDWNPKKHQGDGYAYRSYHGYYDSYHKHYGSKEK